MPQSVYDQLQANLGFVVSQTSHIESEVYRLKYPDLNYAQMVPVDTGANPWVKSVTYYSMDGRGRAKWMNGNSRDVPTVDFEHGQFETSVHSAGIGYDYGLEEVNQASMLGISLESEKARYARRAYEEFVYEVAVNGDAEKGFEGLYNYAGVPANTVANDGTGSATVWTSKTADQILRDINNELTGVYTATNTTAMADTLILPFARFQYIASTRIPDTNMTILEFLRQNNVYTAMTRQPLTILAARGLDTVGSGSTARMIAYRRSPEVLKLHIPMPHQFMPVQIMGLSYIVPGMFRLGGLDIRLPNEVRYADGI